MDTPGTVIGRYEIVRRLGRGGMGSVFLAHHRDLDRLVALKLLRETDVDESLKERFAREAKSVARLDHPNIVRVYDYGDHDGQPYLAMEYVPGETVGDILHKGGPPPLDNVVRWMEQLCDGLAHAHDLNVIHRDVKPANLIISSTGILKVLDFGIARLAGQTLTDGGMLVGTLNYMSPEQIEGTPVDRRTDIFSAGLVMYELVTGRRAFVGSVQDGVMHAILKSPPPSIHGLRPSVPRTIEAIVTKAIQKDRADRYQAFAEFREALGSVRLEGAQLSVSGQDAIDTVLVPSRPRVTQSAVSPQATTTPMRRPPANLDGGVHDESRTFRFVTTLTTVVRERPKTTAAVSMAMLMAVVVSFKLFAPVGAADNPAAVPVRRPPPTVLEPPQPAVTVPPTVAPATGAPTPAAHVTGELSIDATPWARVVSIQAADGTSIALPATDITPVQLTVPAGRYTIVLRNQAGTARTMNASVEAGRRREVIAQFDSISAADYLKSIKR